MRAHLVDKVLPCPVTAHSQRLPANSHARLSRVQRRREGRHGALVCRAAAAAAPGVTFRPAGKADMGAIFNATVRERMNPLGLQADRFTVAERDGQVAACVQLEPKPSEADLQYLELRTLIVEPPYRGQGVGTALLERVLAGAPKGRDIACTTLERSIPFYAPHGFAEVTSGDIPRDLWFEVAAGTVVARVAAGQRLVVLRRRAAAA